MSCFKWLLCLFGLGFVLGPLVELGHNLTETSGYLHPVLFGQQALWVPLLFGLATVSIGVFQNWAWNKISIRPRYHKPSAVGLLIFVLAYIVSGLFHQHSWGIFALLGITSIALWRWSYGHPVSLALGLLLALVGTAFEMVLTTTGHFYYNQPEMLGVPIWLPWLYFIASLAITGVSESILDWSDR